MLTFLSLVTSVKDYIEVVNKFIESDSSTLLSSYENFGAILSYLILSTKTFLIDIVTLNWLQKLWSLPVIIPEIASSMVSEISVLDSYFHNMFNFLETPLSYGQQNNFVYALEKFGIGFINSFFLFLPTSTAHLIIIRRFVMQGLEAGYLAGLGTIAGNLLWIASIVLGWRFIVIPWLSLDIFRYILGFLLLVKYMWDTYNEKKYTLEDLSKVKIFLLSFLIAFTEQTTIYPFVANLSIGSESTLLESFPVSTLATFLTSHGSYLGGILVGSLTFLHLTCWFFENPAYNIYMGIISTFKVTTTAYSKFLNFFFLYLTMICAVSNLAYFGLDYTITNPIGLTHEDRLIDQKALLETSFLSTKASDRNTRRNRGRHGRRERWKRRIRKYRTFDAGLYDQGVYDLFTVEDLNYGFDRFWLRRKMRNHRVRFRFFPGPWMRSFKKQLATPRLESFMGPRVEFFRMLFEQVYHPSFHERSLPTKLEKLENAKKDSQNLPTGIIIPTLKQQNSKQELATIRKFIRKFDTRILTAKNEKILNDEKSSLYSKRWKQILSKESSLNGPIFSKELGQKNKAAELKLKNSENLFYRNFLSESKGEPSSLTSPLSLFHPAKLYLQREKAFRKKLRFYGIQLFRNFGIENNSPYFRVLMRKYFYYYKPTLRWKRTMRNASLRKALRKGPRQPRRFKLNQESSVMNSGNALSRDLSSQKNLNSSNIQLSTHQYSIIGKKASRYRAQIYRDVLQHWYYSPFNRLLLKFDIDDFIRRQPMAHFLTKNEEYLLHLRRFLLSEHYDSFRWYTYMQHYQTMKSKIGGTKSFASGIYNQQFQGTFKKIRHLFAITPNENVNMNTPGLNSKTVLKFDQPLYNEYLNKTSNSIIAESIIHEELLGSKGQMGNNVLDQSTNMLKTYMLNAQPVRQAMIQQFLKEKNYGELTKFIYKGQKTRGEKAVTNRESFVNQEADFLLTQEKQTELTKLQKQKLKELIKTEIKDQSLWLVLLKNAQSQIYDTEALKFYLSRRVEKREKRQERFEKNLKMRLERLSKWFETHGVNTARNTNGYAHKTNLSETNSLNTIGRNSNGYSLELNLKTGIQKALKEAIAYQTSYPNFKQQSSSTKRLFIKNWQAKRLKNYLKTNLKNKIQTFEKIEENIAEQLNKSGTKGISPILKLRSIFNHLSRTFATSLKKMRIHSVISKQKLIDKLDKSEIAQWRKEQNILTKRKKTRKRFKRLKKKQMFNARFAQEDNLFFTADETNSRFKVENGKSRDMSKKIWNQWLHKIDENWTSGFGSSINFAFPKFKVKRSRRRGSMRMRPRSAIRKASLKENLRRRRSRRYSATVTEKGNIFDKLSNGLTSKEPFRQTDLKYRRLRQRKNRYWKRAKRPKYAQTKRKLKRRKRSSLTRIRNLNKQIQRIDSNVTLQNWWNQVFIPRFQGKINSKLEKEKINFLDFELAKLSPAQLLERNKLKTQLIVENIKGEKILEIGNLDYRPLAVPLAIQMREDLNSTKELQTTEKVPSSVISTKEENFIQNFYTKLFSSENENLSTNNIKQSIPSSKFVVNLTGTPFYAGWDETLRKFLVTNRFLSRQDAGYNLNLEKLNLSTNKNFKNFDKNLEFEKAPLRGMNAATTLYWQIPFTTYDPDQFFALGMDGFSPLAWRRFNFRTMKQTTKPILVKTLISSQVKLADKDLSLNSLSFQNSQKKFKKQRIRRLVKRYRRVKKHPKAPVWFPSGPLSQQVLPVHYIYVFYKRFRLPRDRYIRRRLRRSKDGVALGVKDSTSPIPDYTLRRRVKPRRRYHRRRPMRAGEILFPRRISFETNQTDTTKRIRPVSKTRLNQQIQEFRFAKSKAERRRKISNAKDQPMNLRIRQLRRRIQRQVIRPINWRYRPRPGGLVWPGDYLRLESIRAPKLKADKTFKNGPTNLETISNSKAAQKKMKRKKKRMIQEWQIQPKKYLIQKHNLKVLKKRLEKAQNFTEFNQKVKNLNALLTSNQS
uniref:Hypothetical chloroplast RF1 n=1 Tax=Spermatozopsis similis TaxID=3192 RepID=A0A499SAB4_SPESI|nr:hypothetical chloroplast RF1 [Spermatozopsis similis]AYQ95207.1 hypothetical chloroplast RF1 [Spermatozopsis similis]